MAKYLIQEAKKLAVCGDIHGEFVEFVYKCCVQYTMTDTLIIVVGDCGFGFEKPDYYENLYNRCRERLAKANNWIVFVRGNHDNPAYFNLLPIKHQRWMSLPDYSVVKACGHNILCVGGAISIDRTYRMNSRYFHVQKPDDLMAPNVYWLDDRPVFDKGKLDAIEDEIDMVVTHTAPTFCELTSHQGLQDWAVRDEDLITDVKHERKVMDNLLSYLKTKNHPLRQWYYGHFHQSWHQEIDGVRYNMLDCMELREVK